jgi:uncharacterized protein (TIGR00255 family)
MTIESMTGYARAEIEAGGEVFTWEIRSVNGKGLDIRVRMPSGYERMEIPARQAIQKKFRRGSIQAGLSVARPGAMTAPVVNEAFLRDVAGLAKRLEEQFGCRPASADGLLSLKGVLEVPEAGAAPGDRETSDATLLEALEEALEGLEKARREEGAAIAELLRERVATLELLALRAESDPSRSTGKIREQLTAQVAQLLASSSALDESRLHQEVAILATKADIAEEIDRVKTHVESVRQMLDEGGPIGRKLDFIAQEFNREANTLCSKSNAASITAIGLEMKVAIDQFREQVQNVE